MWFAGKAGPDRTVPASEGEDSRQPPSIPGPDKRSGPLLYLLTLLSLSEARQRGVGPTEKHTSTLEFCPGSQSISGYSPAVSHSPLGGQMPEGISKPLSGSQLRKCSIFFFPSSLKINFWSTIFQVFALKTVPANLSPANLKTGF